MNIYLDLETIPSRDPAVRMLLADGISPPGNISKPETIAKWIAESKPAAVDEAVAKTSFDGAYGSIVCVGVAFDDDPAVALYREDWQAPDTERNILSDLFSLISGAMEGPSQRRPRFIGHNLVEFDLKFLFQRCVMLGLRPPSIIPFAAKPWSDEVYDTMTAWAGLKNRVSLDKLAAAMKIGDKGGISGADVWPMVQEGRIVEVAEYCKNDVELTRALHKRMTFA